MKKIQTLISAGAVAAVTALPVVAQQAQYTTTRMGDETAMQIAQRVGACGQSGGISAANYASEEDALIRVTCAGGGLSGGLATGGAIAGAIAAITLVGLASDGDDTSTTTTTTTTGTTN